MNSLGRIIEIIILVILIAITAYFYIKARKESYEAARKADEEAKKPSEENSKFILTAKVDGMMCEKCASRVTQALSSLGEVNVNLDEKTVTITSDELTDAVEVEKIITELGYKFEGIAQ